jgi:protein tyrosine/serine phosphatase
MRLVEHSRRHAITAALSLVLAGPAFAQAPLRAITADSVTIYNFAKVNDRYYRGGQPLGEHFADLAALGVTTIVNLTNEKDGVAEERMLAERHGMRYVNIPMTTRKAPTDDQIATFMSIVDNPDGGAVYVHCVGGRHRTGVMTAIYRMTKDGLTGEQAFKEMKRYKYGPDFLHPEFKKFVYQYQPKTAAAAASQQ